METKMTDIDMERLRGLKSGKMMPERFAEELFMQAYNLGMTGALFLLTLSEIEDSTGLTVEEYDYFLLGYGWGQHDLMELENQNDNKLH